jgi:hypothetical protein
VGAFFSSDCPVILLQDFQLPKTITSNWTMILDDENSLFFACFLPTIIFLDYNLVYCKITYFHWDFNTLVV